MILGLLFLLSSSLNQAFSTHGVASLFPSHGFVLLHIESQFSQQKPVPSQYGAHRLKRFLREERISKASFEEYLIGNAPAGMHFFHGKLQGKKRKWHAFLGIGYIKNKPRIITLSLIPAP